MVARDQRGDVGMSGYAIERGMTTGGCDQFVSIIRTDGRKMLVAGDFSNPDQSQANHHSSSHFYLSDIYASYLSRFALSTDSGHGLKLCIEKRSEERRGGKECVSSGRYRWSPYH